MASPAPPTKLNNLPQEIRDKIWSKVRDEMRSAPAIHFLHMYVNAYSSPWSYVADMLQTGLFQASAYSSAGGKDRMLMQVDSTTAYTVQEMQKREVIDSSAGVESPNNDPDVITWPVYTDPLSEEPTVPFVVNTEKDLVCLQQPLHAVAWFAPVHVQWWGASEYKHFKPRDWRPEGGTWELKNLGLVWDAGLYHLDCPGCKWLKRHYKELRRQVAHRHEMQRKRAEAGLPKPACTMCAEVERAVTERTPANAKAGEEDSIRNVDPDHADDTVSVCSEDADDDDFHFYNISGQAQLFHHRWAFRNTYTRNFKPDLSSSSFKPRPGQDPKKVHASSKDVPLIRHGDHPHCHGLTRIKSNPMYFQTYACWRQAKTRILRPQFASMIGQLADDLFPRLNNLFLIDYSISLDPDTAEIPLDSPHWFDNAGGVYVAVKEHDPFRRTAFEFAAELSPRPPSYEVYQGRIVPNNEKTVSVMAYVKVADRSRFDGLVNFALDDSILASPKKVWQNPWTTPYDSDDSSDSDEYGNVDEPGQSAELNSDESDYLEDESD
ncbi:hypothetical protein QBC34DRAFT_494788 [Podospora aff. communis PSN243]|uniref:Uncharacterized protein n=1 Tax=Podospora aff. communis PSN243 TaxID=3040156 RepID=A0AAV9GKH6_9PEZI|nr:hypothetical protein QBC34DRAFT_494788 [Podospora aff. communis PSN243]